MRWEKIEYLFGWLLPSNSDLRIEVAKLTAPGDYPYKEVQVVGRVAYGDDSFELTADQMEEFAAGLARAAWVLRERQHEAVSA